MHAVGMFEDRKRYGVDIIAALNTKWLIMVSAGTLYNNEMERFMPLKYYRDTMPHSFWEVINNNTAVYIYREREWGTEFTSLF